MEAASKVQISKKEPVKTQNPERNANSSVVAAGEDVTKRFSICYMEAQNQEGNNVRCQFFENRVINDILSKTLLPDAFRCICR